MLSLWDFDRKWWCFTRTRSDVIDEFCARFDGLC